MAKQISYAMITQSPSKEEREGGEKSALTFLKKGFLFSFVGGVDTAAFPSRELIPSFSSPTSPFWSVMIKSERNVWSSLVNMWLIHERSNLKIEYLRIQPVMEVSQSEESERLNKRW